MAGVIAQDLVLDAAQRRPHRRELRHHVDAIAILVDHARKPAHLAFDALQALEDRSLGIRLHGGYIPPQGIWFKLGIDET